jgi:TonB family protein
LVHLDFDDRHRDELVVGSAIPPQVRVVVSLLVHGLVLALLIIVPQLTLFQLIREQQAQRLEELRRRRPAAQQDRTFVFVQPRVDLEAPKPPERGPASDKDRIASNRERPENPTNPLPFARGNSRERVEAPVTPPQRAAGPVSPSPPAPGEAVEPQQQTPGEQARQLPQSENGLTVPREGVVLPERRAASGALGDAIRNLQRYVQNESFDNRSGGTAQFGPFLQFDTKGVEFGPWVRRFVAQVKRNWFIPDAAMFSRGHVVLQFNVHKDGRITDVAVVGPSNIDAFNNSSANAILASNPTEPLPPEYPADKAFFTVTFYYNEEPPAR